ncbi:DMT family transporter [Paracrocinitomix mangrovi]|uniref:DMT family transporter n=1 Tax=Paracrocinitomix mangrovi TaxID=2862509 RepID=UPI001C8CF89C|nr:DMT family transporter [Paracrocinitomix mangrovi]UKN02471.1 DMT family transporter [Paracrocinitomix mangrovi]
MYKGILYMLLSSFCFALINICVKILSNSNHALDKFGDVFSNIQEYPPQELVLFRSIISLTICIAIIRAKKIPFFGNNKKWLLIRGAAGATALTLFFVTLQNLPLAIATTVQYLSPVFTIIFAIYLQKEKVFPVQWLFFLISFSGIAIIGFVKESDLSVNPLWVLVGLTSAVISGIAYNAIMKCRDTDQPITIVMYFPLVATPVMLILCLTLGYVIPQGIEWVLLIAIGILTQIAQVTMTRAFHADSAARVSPVKYVGAIYAVAAGFFIFNEELGLISSIGIILVLTGVLLNTFVKLKRQEKFSS